LKKVREGGEIGKGDGWGRNNEEEGGEERDREGVRR
jgi:hypothetical protein